MKPVKLYESLFILYKCNLNLERLKNLMDAIGDSFDTHSDYALLYTYYINLEAVSFLEEFKDGLSKSESVYTNYIYRQRKFVIEYTIKGKKNQQTLPDDLIFALCTAQHELENFKAVTIIL